MDKGLLLFQNINPKIEYVNQIFSFDVSKLESTDSIDISRFGIALAQYLIYFQSGLNNIKIDINKKKRFLETTVNQILTTDILKQNDNNKTKARDVIISGSEKLNTVRDEMELLQDELLLLEGQDRNISELIAVFKRELTRRENEMYAIRKER